MARLLEVGIKDAHWRGDAEIRINGPFVYLSATW